MFSEAIIKKVQALLDECRQRELRTVTAESCTGGLLAACLTELPGSSAVVDRGFVTYSNWAKHEVLGVPKEMLREAGAVSKPVACAMAQGALKASRNRANISVALTGIAGPRGDTTTKPVGLVHIASAYGEEHLIHKAFHFTPTSRSSVRMDSLEAALDMMKEIIR
ncbi:MAG: CinA family protein [Parvularculales bacterium]